MTFSLQGIYCLFATWEGVLCSWWRAAVSHLLESSWRGRHVVMNMNALIMAAPPSLMTLPCCHSFHDACVTAWLGKAANCPMCRFCISDNTYRGEFSNVVTDRLGKLVWKLWNDIATISNILTLLWWQCEAEEDFLPRAELPTDDPQWEEMKRQKKRKERREEDLEALHNSMFGWKLLSVIVLVFPDCALLNWINFGSVLASSHNQSVNDWTPFWWN